MRYVQRSLLWSDMFRTGVVREVEEGYGQESLRQVNREKVRSWRRVAREVKGR